MNSLKFYERQLGKARVLESVKKVIKKKEILWFLSISVCGGNNLSLYWGNLLRRCFMSPVLLKVYFIHEAQPVYNILGHTTCRVCAAALFIDRHSYHFLSNPLDGSRSDRSAHGVIFEDRLSDYPSSPRRADARARAREGGHARLSASWLRSTVIIHHFPRKLINTDGQTTRGALPSTFVRHYRSRLDRSRSRLIPTASYTREIR